MSQWHSPDGCQNSWELRDAVQTVNMTATHLRRGYAIPDSARAKVLDRVMFVINDDSAKPEWWLKAASVFLQMDRTDREDEGRNENLKLQALKMQQAHVKELMKTAEGRRIMEEWAKLLSKPSAAGPAETAEAPPPALPEPPPTPPPAE